MVGGVGGTGLRPKAGLTSWGGQKAQVVETLVAIELPLLKQEVHHLSGGGLRLGVQMDGQRGQTGVSMRGRQAGGTGGPGITSFPAVPQVILIRSQG